MSAVRSFLPIQIAVPLVTRRKQSVFSGSEDPPTWLFRPVLYPITRSLIALLYPIDSEFGQLLGFGLNFSPKGASPI